MADQLFESLLQSKMHEAAAIESEKRHQLANPLLMDRAVADMSDYLSPTASMKKPKGEIYGTDTVEASKSKDDPTLGFGIKLRDEYAKSLMDPNTKRIPAGQLLSGLATKMMDTPDETGRTLKTKAYEYNQTEDSRLWGGTPHKMLPGQEDWNKDRKLQEKQNSDKESWLPSWSDLATGAGMGAGLGAVVGGTSGGMSAGAAGAATGGAMGLGIGGPLGGVIGAGLGGLAGYFGGEATGAALGGVTGAITGAGAELVAAPLKKLLHTTDWYHGMVASNSAIDKAKLIGAEMLTYLPGGLMTEAGIARSGLVPKKLSGTTTAADTVDAVGGDVALPPQMKQIGYDPARTTTPGEGVLFDADGNIVMQPTNVGAGTTYDAAGNIVKGPSDTIMGGPGMVQPKELPPGTGAIPGEAPIEGNTPFNPEINNLLEGGNRAEGVKTNTIDHLNLGPSAPGELSGADLQSFEDFKPLVKNYYGDKPVSEQEMFNIWKQRSDNTASQKIEDAVARVEKAKNDIATNPVASNVLDTAKTKPTKIEPTPGSSIVEQSQNLSSEGLQEVGLEPPTTPGIKPLQGSLAQKIPQAVERDTFVKLGKENNDGPLRTQLADTTAKTVKKKIEPVSLDNSKASEIASIADNNAPFTPKEQEMAITNVNKYDAGGTAVEEEFFPEVKARPLEDLRKEYNDYRYEGRSGTPEERMAQLREEATMEIKAGMKKDKPITPEAIDKKVQSLLRDETDNFKDWLDTNGHTAPPEVAAKDFDINSPEGSLAGKKYSTIAGMAALGVGIGALVNLMSAKNADAGMFSSIVEGVAGATKGAAVGAAKATKGSVMSIMQEAADRGLISEAVKPGQMVLKDSNIQTGIIQDAGELMDVVGQNIRAGKGTGTQYALMSPYQAIEALFTTGKGKVINAATNLASFVTAGSRNTNNAQRIIKNVLDDAGIETQANAIKTAMKPNVPLGAKAAKAEMAANELKNWETKLAEATKKVDANDPAGSAADVAIAQDQVTKFRTTVQELDGAVEAYQNAWTGTAKELAGQKDMGSLRISLALEDPGRTLYPWLPQLSREEEIAAGRIRGLLDQYQGRLKARDIPTLDNYLPHSPHPDMAKLYNDELKDLLGGAPYQEFYHRTANSRPLLPDINYTMNHYLADIEPRIQNHDFWDTSGWRTVKDSTLIQSNPGLKRAFDQLYEGTKPAENTWGNIAAQKYSEFEAVNKLFLNPSAGLKHIVKAFSDIASVGPAIAGKSVPEALGYVGRKMLDKGFGMNQTSLRDVLGKLGVNSERFSRTLLDDYMDSTIMSGNVRKYMFDMGIDDHQQIFNTAANIWRGVQDVGSSWISLAELIDRGTSVSSALQMAAKKGMTVDQAMYGTYDLILKNNFLFSQFNPTWLNNPKIRALFMFQATPFKIMERRLVNAQRSYANLGQLSEGMQKVIKDPGQGWDKVWKDVKDMKAYMRDGQSELKSNLFIDTLRNETDFFGTPIVKQMATDMLTVGAATYGGAQVGLALSDHFFHIPFLKQHGDTTGKPELAVNPLIGSTIDGYNAWKSRESGEDFLLGSITRRWLGKYGPLPQTLEKAVRLSDGDIPAIYRKGGDSAYLKYLFGVPGKD